MAGALRIGAAALLLLLVLPSAFAQFDDEVDQRQAEVAERVSADYAAGLAAYSRRDWAEAENRFRSIVDLNRREPTTIRSYYFLARALMQQKRWEEASTILLGIYSLSPAFYREWSCDFLLGVAREAMGKG